MKIVCEFCGSGWHWAEAHLNRRWDNCHWELFNYFSYCCDQIPDKEHLRQGEVYFDSWLDWTCNRYLWIVSFPRLAYLCVMSCTMLTACVLFRLCLSDISWFTSSLNGLKLLPSYTSFGFCCQARSSFPHSLPEPDLLSFTGFITVPVLSMPEISWVA